MLWQVKLTESWHLSTLPATAVVQSKIHWSNLWISTVVFLNKTTEIAQKCEISKKVSLVWGLKIESAVYNAVDFRCRFPSVSRGAIQQSTGCDPVHEFDGVRIVAVGGSHQFGNTITSNKHTRKSFIQGEENIASRKRFHRIQVRKQQLCSVLAISYLGAKHDFEIWAFKVFLKHPWMKNTP